MMCMLTVCPACPGPVWVVVVDDNGMTVHCRPTKMGVVLRQVVVAVCDRCILLLWPEHHASQKPYACHQCQNDERDDGTEGRDQPP